MSDALHQALRDWQAAGVDGLAVHAAALWPSPADDNAAGPAPPAPPAAVQSRTDQTVVTETIDAVPMAAAAKLDLLSQKVAACVLCPELAETRRQTVFGTGDPNAAVLFLGEAPGADEDATGVPFVGKAGQLLDKIIAASGWRREEIYICNILRCRPPGNRNPMPAEAGNCRQWLDAQIEAVRPDWIVCWGSVAAKNLLGVDSPIGKLRQQLFDHGDARVLCTYHPSYLLRNPAAKKDVWADLKFLFEAMGHTPPSP